ncbi:GtrA family protein [Robertmurraya massiliosenegalensis]|uniref:GtrA family protein n=1 Tax=Robertmurraya massiliosenegalensis TaxID=1287657 RepID=UPI00035E11BB|nr:GtrA family protein [Robertmurraya massiliosenegalensis]
MNPFSLIMGKYLTLTNSFVRFLLVGCVNTFVGLSTSFVLLNGLGFNYWLATFFGNSIGATCSFILNRSFTFQSNVTVKKAGIRFILIVLFCYWISYLLSAVVAEFFSLNGLFTTNELAVLIGAFFYTVSNYFGQKFLVFR